MRMNVFIDTNILLSFFHFSTDDLEELRKLRALIEHGELSLIIPEQVRDEFYRNRASKIADSLARLDKKEFAIELPQLCKHYEQYAALCQAQRSLEEARRALLGLVQADAGKECLKADLVLNELFANVPPTATTHEVLEAAQSRTKKGNPPGKKGSLGDAVNWETLLRVAPSGEDLHFVTDDVDFASPLDRSRFDEFLLREWYSRKQSNIYYHRTLSGFLKTNFPNIKLAAEARKEVAISQWERSGTFAETHVRVQELSSFSDFTLDQVSRILRAALENSQITWIIGDPDVTAFLQRVLDAHERQVDPVLVGAVRARMPQRAA